MVLTICAISIIIYYREVREEPKNLRSQGERKMCDMPKYDLTVEEIISIIGYLELMRDVLIHNRLVTSRTDVSPEHIDSLIVALKKIKLYKK